MDNNTIILVFTILGGLGGFIAILLFIPRIKEYTYKKTKKYRLELIYYRVVEWFDELKKVFSERNIFDNARLIDLDDKICLLIKDYKIEDYETPISYIFKVNFLIKYHDYRPKSKYETNYEYVEKKFAKVTGLKEWDVFDLSLFISRLEGNSWHVISCQRKAINYEEGRGYGQILNLVNVFKELTIGRMER